MSTSRTKGEKTDDQAVQGEEFNRLLRPARALIGWMTPEQAHLTQVARRADAPITDEVRDRAMEARKTVQIRPLGVDQTDLVTAAPTELSQHLIALRAHPPAAPFFEEGWRVAIVDLARVCAIQPVVFNEDAEARVANVEPADVSSIARVTLPVEPPEPLAAQQDGTHTSWLFTSRNPNLRVVAQFSGEVQPGLSAYGFSVVLTPSYLQVAKFEDRYILRDGYHRSFGLLARGITHVPAFVRDFESMEQLGLPPGLLPQTAYLGERPPVLTDYSDDAVAADVQVPSTQKVIAIQALEYTVMS